MRTSRMIVFFAISSSSDSLNFLIATRERFPPRESHMKMWVCRLTKFARLLAFGFVDDAVGAFAHDADDLVLIHI